jgi:hypothetical protein
MYSQLGITTLGRIQSITEAKKHSTKLFTFNKTYLNNKRNSRKR